MDEKCIFCGIVAKQIPSFKVYEDDKFFAFLDIRPLNKGHTLVIPKKHHRWTYEIEHFGPYWEVAKKIALAQIKAMDSKFVQFITAGLGVAHAHIHVIPRYENDGHGEYLDPSKVKQMTETELKITMEKIKAAIPADEPKVIVEKPPKVPARRTRYTREQMLAFRRDTERT